MISKGLTADRGAKMPRSIPAANQFAPAQQVQHLPYTVSVCGFFSSIPKCDWDVSSRPRFDILYNFRE